MAPTNVTLLPPTTDVPLHRVLVRLPAHPSPEALDAIFSEVLGFCRRQESLRFALHIEAHQQQDDAPPPDAPLLFRVAGKLLDHRELVDERVVGTCIQVPSLDAGARMARDIFLGLYQPCTKLCLAETPEDVRNFLRELVPRVRRLD